VHECEQLRDVGKDNGLGSDAFAVADDSKGIGSGSDAEPPDSIGLASCPANGADNQSTARESVAA
jgi:hypothetical protein